MWVARPAESAPVSRLAQLAGGPQSSQLARPHPARWACHRPCVGHPQARHLWAAGSGPGSGPGQTGAPGRRPFYWAQLCGSCHPPGARRASVRVWPASGQLADWLTSRPSANHCSVRPDASLPAPSGRLELSGSGCPLGLPRFPTTRRRVAHPHDDDSTQRIGLKESFIMAAVAVGQ